ncbi:Uncharacterized protein OBRU01_20445, partial [Operophtera brumata]
TTLVAGTVQKLSCVSGGGNPLATLTWYKNDKKVNSVTRTQNNSVSADISILTNVTDNQAQYRCEATNSATEIPLFETQKKGLHGGTVSTIELKLNITKELNGAVYTCQATNEALERNAPIFDEATPYTTVGVENEPLIIVIRADGNPASISYTWTKDGLPITQSSYSSSSKFLIFINFRHALTRFDKLIHLAGSMWIAGYPASIKSVSQDGLSNPNEDAMLSCTAVGNPLTSDHIRWVRKDYTIQRDQVSFDSKNSTSYLLLREPTRADVGNFQCVVNNGIGGESRQNVMLVVKFKPEMDSAPNLAKAACKSAPAPNFTWSKNGAKLPVNTSTKYFAEYVKADAVTYTSVLLINDVTSSDYGTYECGARNDLGFSTTSGSMEACTPGSGSDTGILPTSVQSSSEEFNSYSVPGVFIITGTIIGTALILLNVLLIGYCLHRRTNKRIRASSEAGELNVVATEYVESADVSKPVIVYVSVTAAVLILINAGLNTDKK